MGKSELCLQVPQDTTGLFRSNSHTESNKKDTPTKGEELEQRKYKNITLTDDIGKPLFSTKTMSRWESDEDMFADSFRLKRFTSRTAQNTKIDFAKKFSCKNIPDHGSGLLKLEHVNFPQVMAKYEVAERLNKNMVSLDELSTRNDKLVAMVKVKNISYEKDVCLEYPLAVQMD